MGKKHYVLGTGKEFHAVIAGEPVCLIGNGKATVELTEEQAIAFADKLVGPSEDAVDFPEQDDDSDDSAED